MYIGIDGGTSAVKAVLVDEDEATVAVAESPLQPTFPRPGWSEDDPANWWRATENCLDHLSSGHAGEMSGVRAIGLAGQMHSAVLLDDRDRPVRPAILWNDGRAKAEADELAEQRPDLALVLGVVPMPGFTGPKLLWLTRHEPETMRKSRSLCFAKDYLRLRLTGQTATDVSDASGGWLLDQRSRTWSQSAVAACGADGMSLPEVVESNVPTGTLRAELAARWGMPRQVVVAGGAGDVPAGGVGIGAVDEGQGFISLGTSAQIFVADRVFSPRLGKLVHAFSHAVPERWFRMAAMLNGASPIASTTGWLGHDSIDTMMGRVEARYAGPGNIIALPYLFGERTPHNDPHARGAFIGLTPSTTREDLLQAMLEGVAYSLADGLGALTDPDHRLSSLALIGGGARSRFWADIIASVLNVPLVRYTSSNRGPAFGAARLARLASGAEEMRDVLTPPAVLDVIEPTEKRHSAYSERLHLFRDAYASLKSLMGRQAQLARSSS